MTSPPGREGVAGGGGPVARRRPLRVRVALVLAVLLVAALLVEGAARLLWRAPWYEELRAAQRASQEHAYTQNAWGLRDRDYAPEKPEGTRRLLVLGDSYTYGLGVTADERVFPELLERRLNEEGPGPVEVLNAGDPATLTGHWVRILEVLGPSFDPDAVLVVFFPRDGTETLFIPEYFMRIESEILARNRASLAYRWSRAWRLLRDRLDVRLVQELYGRRFLDAYLGDEHQTAEWARARSNLVRLRDLARERSARIGLAVFPVLARLDEDHPFRPIHDVLLEFGASIGVPTHDLLEAFQGRRAADLWVSPWDQHPNERAHAIAAESLLPFARELLAPPR